jgi:uncharacterized coiled-coil protein SlyX
MIDINAIISQALAAAVQQATQPLLERIEALEIQEDTQHARLRVLIGVLTDRVAVLEQSSSLDKLRLDDMAEKLTALEVKLTEAQLFQKTTEVQIDKDDLLEHLDNQEWFWDKIRHFTDGAVEAAIEQHCEEYDHDDMLLNDALPDMNDYVTKDELDSEVRDAVHDIMDGATVSIRL